MTRSVPHGRHEDQRGAFVEDRLAFSERTAERLIQISDVIPDRIANRSHVTDLPASWRTLDALATLDDSQWANVEPHIRPDMERKEIKRLLGGSKSAAPALPSDKYRVVYADPPWKYSDTLIEGYGAVVTPLSCRSRPRAIADVLQVLEFLRPSRQLAA